MGSFSDFLEQMDWWGLITLLISAAAALISITFHELSHGLTAYRLGDPTAKNAGRLTLNPVRHLDMIGLLMMLVVKVGWAKPVPVDMRNFKHPKRDMAVTALAGPVCNFVLAFLSVGVFSLLYHLAPVGHVSLLLMCFCSNLAILNVGLGMFNLIPISPLDGSKILLALLPGRFYNQVLRYERYVMILLVVLTFFGVFQGPLSFLMIRLLRILSKVTGLPLNWLLICRDASVILNLL